MATRLNKTDANDAVGLAQTMRTGWYRELALYQRLGRSAGQRRRFTPLRAYQARYAVPSATIANASGGVKMEFRQIRYFVTIVDYGSLTKAATYLGIAQPALSLQISNLEAEYRAQLLVRSPKGVKPTEVGKILYRRGRALLRELEQAREEMRTGVQRTSGLVAIGLPTTVTVPLALPLVRAVRDEYPAIRLQLFESLSGYLDELLANSRLDLAILFRDVETRGVSVTPLLRERLYLIGDSGLRDDVRAHDVCSVADLRDVPLALPRANHNLRLTVERAFAQAGLETNTIADIDSPRTMVALADAGIACTILPLSALSPGWESERGPRARRIVSPEIVRTMSLCRLEKTAPSPAASAVEKVILAVIPQLVAQGKWPGASLLDDKGPQPDQ